MAVHALHKTTVPRPYTLFVALHGGRLVTGTAADRKSAVLAADASLCRLYDVPATVPTVHNCTVTAARNVVCAIDLTRWPITCPCHIVVLSPTPPPAPF